jgi:hypothetical protein
MVNNGNIMDERFVEMLCEMEGVESPSELEQKKIQDEIIRLTVEQFEDDIANACEHFIEEEDESDEHLTERLERG